MATMNISLNDTLRDYVQERLANGGFSNASDYMRSLIREDRARFQRQNLENLLLEGLASGEPEPVDAEFWRAMRLRAGE